MLRFLLEEDGHTVVEAADRLRAIELAMTIVPDVALIDIGLPEVDGFEVARRIRSTASGRTIRLVALTGYGTADDRRRAENAGFDLHLVKPVDPVKLIGVIAASPRCA